MSHKLVSLYIGDGEYYTRTDADAVIAELKADYKEACDRLQTANLIKDEQIVAARHHKYKRCLAMADKCAEAYKRECGLNPEEMTDKEFYKQQIEFWPRWNSKWLKIGEKFKDGV